MSATYAYKAMWLADLHAGEPQASRQLAQLDGFLATGVAERYYLLGDILDRFRWIFFPDGFDLAAFIAVQSCLARYTSPLNSAQVVGNHDILDAWPLLRRFDDDDNLLLEHGRWVAVHGHTQDYLWRIGYLMLLASKPAPPSAYHDRQRLRERLVQASGLYQRLAGLGARHGVPVVIHGHAHLPGVRTLAGVHVVCVPDWVEHAGGALVEYPDGKMALVDCRHAVTQWVG